MRKALVVASLLLLTACPRDDTPTVSTDETTSSTTSTTTLSITPLPASAPAGTTRGLLKDVRVAAQGGFDRVVFEFEGALPGYRVATTEAPVHEDGSGDEVDVEGSALLEVRFDNASGVRFEGERVVEVYTGPDRVRSAGTQVVAEVVELGDFEGTVTWVIGLRTSTGVQVSTLTSPHRLVVDVPTDS
jgi:hypothetical protein